jgi:hypothetical protein
LTDEYDIRFSIKNTTVTEAFVNDTIQVTLFSTTGASLQEKEISNFNTDMSDIQFTNCNFVEGSLTNAIDPVGFAPEDLGFLKRWENRPMRTSLTHEIKFQIMPAAGSVAIVTCKGNVFQIQNKGNEQKSFYLNITSLLSATPPNAPKPPEFPVASSNENMEYVVLIVIGIWVFSAFVYALIYWFMSKYTQSKTTLKTTQHRVKR